MTHLIVPTDFSETSRNAVRYACQMAQDIHDCQVVLFNSYENDFSGSDGSPLSGQEDTTRAITLLALENLAGEYRADEKTIFRFEARKGSFLRNLEEILTNYPGAMIVMGMRGASRVEQIFIGSSTLRVVEHLSCPVLVIPPQATYRKIRTVVFSSDLRNVRETTPVQALKSFLRWFTPKLIVAYVNMDQQDSEDYKQEKTELDILLQGFWPEYHIVRINDFATAIHNLAVEKEADVIITVPRKHRFWERVFTSSHTSKLAYHTDIPLLTIHE